MADQDPPRQMQPDFRQVVHADALPDPVSTALSAITALTDANPNGSLLMSSTAREGLDMGAIGAAGPFPIGLENLTGMISERDLVPEDMPLSRKVFFVVSYSLIMVLSVIGNLLVIVVVAGRRKMRTVTNTFLVSLAVSDLLIAGLNMPLQLRFHLTNEWTLGEPMCKFTNYIQGVTIVASILTLTGIAADRYYAICHPLRARHVHTIRRALIILTFFWILALTLMVPQLFIQRLEPLFKRQPPGSPLPLRVVHVCVEFFEDFHVSATYTLTFYTVLYLLPVAIMSVTYGKIAYTLWIRGPIGETPEGSRDRRLMEKKRVVRMLLVIMVLFAVSWFPFFTCHVYLLFHRDEKSFRVVLAVLQLFGYSNSCSNPIVYCFLNQSFRQNFLKSLCIPSSSHRRRRTYTSAFSMDNDRMTGKFETTGNSIITEQESKFSKYEMSARNTTGNNIIADQDTKFNKYEMPTRNTVSKL